VPVYVWFGGGNVVRATSDGYTLRLLSPVVSTAGVVDVTVRFTTSRSHELVLAQAFTFGDAAAAVPALSGLLAREAALGGADESALKYAAAYALGRIGPASAPAVEALRSLSKSEDELMASVAIWALLKIEPDNKAQVESAVPVLRKALQKLGHEVIEAKDGQEAWALMEAEPVRVIVSDWMMPNLSGLELCRKLRARSGSEYVYFILITANSADSANRIEAADAGVDDFLSKPLNVEELWMRLRVAERILRFATQVRQLEELLPICSYCKKIRDDQNYWQQMEGYINERTGSEFSHSVCPDCMVRVVQPEIDKMRAERVIKKP
jgi:CheY-like chemotaxis protein